jgi:hypothetical protein
MELVRDELISYQGGPFGPKGVCNLRVWTAPGRRPVVCLTELEDNPGMSVTNAIEKLAAQVRPTIEGPEPVWIDKGQDWHDGQGPSIAEVHFGILDPGEVVVTGGVFTAQGSAVQTAGRYANPQWMHCTAEELAEKYGIEV